MKQIAIFLTAFLILFGVSCGRKNSSPAYPELSEATTEVLAPSSGKTTEIRSLAHPDPAENQDYEQKHSNPNEIPLADFVMHKAHSGLINALAISRDGLKAYSGGQDGQIVSSTIIKSVQRKDQAGSQPAAIRIELIASSNKPILALSLSPNEKKLLVSLYSTVVVYDLEGRQVDTQLTRIRGRIPALAWDPRGELVAFGRANGDIFVWNLRKGRQAGADNTESLERYELSSSPIVSIIFHPSGRAFFAAERDGGVYIWRNLRTERELSLRDEASGYGEDLAGGTVERVGGVGGQIEDMWLDENASILYVSAADGGIYRWKVRGLRALKKINAGADSVTAIQGVQLAPGGAAESERYGLIAGTGRGQRLKLWCRKPEESAWGSVPSEPAPVLQSALFFNPLNLLRGGEGAAYLWAAQKTGNVVTFDANFLLNSPFWRDRIEGCKD